MKYAFMSFSTPELTLGEMLALAKRAGYDGLEPRLVSKHAHGIETDIDAATRRAVRRQFEDSGIAAACVATSCRYADPATTAQNVQDTRNAVDLAADIGSSRIRVFGGQIGKGIERQAAIGIVADALAAVADHAASRDVTVCVETHDDWCDPKHVAAVMHRVNHPAIAVNWDVMHPVRTGAATMEEAFQTLKPWIRHLHVHDGTAGSLELAPIGTGAYDHRTAVKLLLAAGYDGYLSGEWIGWSDPYESHLPREVATLRGYERELAR